MACIVLKVGGLMPSIKFMVGSGLFDSLLNWICYLARRNFKIKIIHAQMYTWEPKRPRPDI